MSLGAVSYERPLIARICAGMLWNRCASLGPRQRHPRGRLAPPLPLDFAALCDLGRQCLERRSLPQIEAKPLHPPDRPPRPVPDPKPQAQAGCPAEPSPGARCLLV
jgi:hypothetical protein